MPFRAIADDPEVMRYLPEITHESSDRIIGRMNALQASCGHCLWAVERLDDGKLLGSCGLLPPRAPAYEYEIGWRLARDCWGQGYAREAAQASINWAWRNLDTLSLVAITVPANERSWGLMLRLGMIRDASADFDHPNLPPDDPLRRHVLYRIGRSRNGVENIPFTSYN